MRIWFDTEFREDGRHIDLISIGMVREDGATFYRETAASRDLANSTDWLRANVLPHLKETPWPNEDIGREITEFAGPSPEFWAYYASYDWVALCQLFGTMMDLPRGWPMWCRDLKHLCADLNDPALPKQNTAEHHALADAIWTKDAYDYLRTYERTISRIGFERAAKQFGEPA